MHKARSVPFRAELCVKPGSTGASLGMRRIPHAVRESGAKMATEPRSGTESARDWGLFARSICATWGFGEAWRRKGAGRAVIRARTRFRGHFRRSRVHEALE